LPRKRGVKATVASSPLGSSRQSLVRGVQSQHGSKSTTAIGICCTPKNGLTWQLSAVVRSSSKASETSSDHPQQPAIVRTNRIDLAIVRTSHRVNPRVADEAVYVVNASRVRVHGMEGIDITCLICHSGELCLAIGLDGAVPFDRIAPMSGAESTSGTPATGK
jgi:hypothetical protein